MQFTSDEGENRRDDEGGASDAPTSTPERRPPLWCCSRGGTGTIIVAYC